MEEQWSSLCKENRNSSRNGDEYVASFNKNLWAHVYNLIPVTLVVFSKPLESVPQDHTVLVCCLWLFHHEFKFSTMTGKWKQLNGNMRYIHDYIK